jgi:magnesium chelatase family protein
MTATYPACFMLVAAMNPCQCGYFGDSRRPCRCTPQQIRQYQGRISGPLLDRIDIHIEVPSVRYRELTARETGESSAAVKARIEQALEIQKRRFAGVDTHVRPQGPVRLSPRRGVAAVDRNGH